ncbi:DUF7551 domain-containing protein [Halorientalis sp.]|jgi:hypothetical protein|uniref:DUF7551 domain-containing protein n=1 Tax=Halorientalis sp. TaxID=1931229 RepID=UPI0026177DD6|nr:hypothetical protein [Halorientalis sp.]
MVGETLSKIRARIDDLAVDGGEYWVVCGRTGVCPVPVAGARFPDRETAEKAAEAAVAYRAVLRRWDPQAPCYDFIACEEPSHVVRTVTPPPTGETASLTGFCHDVAAAVFETLSAQGHADLESSIMDVYCETADAIDDPDDLCLHLLRTLSFELGARLPEAEQAVVLRRAAAELANPDDTGRPLEATLQRLQRLDIVDGYTVDAHGDGSDMRAWTVTITNYALTSQSASLPTLPIAIDLLGRLPGPTLTVSDPRRLDGRQWQFDLAVTEDGVSGGLVRVRADSSV